MPLSIPQRVSPFEPLGGLQLIRINPADASFFVFLIFLWVELGYRSFWQTPGYLPEPTTVSIVCATIRFILSVATNLGVNIIKNMELGHDISILHRVTVPSNDCESFGLTAIFAMVFFSLRRFITQGVIFLIIPAFDYYMCLWMHLLVAVIDEFMFPFSYVARLKEHRHQAFLDAISKDQSQIVTPPTLPPSPIRSLTGQNPTSEFQPKLSFSGGASPTPAKKKQNASVHQSKSGRNSDPRSNGLRSSPPRPHIDESPLNREELELYTLVAGRKSASTIQSYPQWRVLFRLDIPLHLEELEARQKAAAALRASSRSTGQSSTISKTPSAPDAISQSTEGSTPAPAPPLNASDKGKGKATTSSLEMPKSLVMISNPVAVPSASRVPLDLPKPTPPVATTPTVAPPQVPTPPLKAPNKGKGKPTTSNLFIPSKNAVSKPIPPSSSAPTVPSSPPKSTAPPATTSVVTPQAPTPPPNALNKGEAATSNLFIPSKPAANKSTPSTSAPKVPSQLSKSTLPVDSSPQAPSSSLPTSAPIPHVAPPQPNPTTPAVFSPAAPVTPRHQAPDYAVDADGDCVMMDVFEEPWRSVQLFLGPVAPVETVSEMEVIPTPTEPELMEMTPTVSNDEYSQASMDAEPTQVYSVVCPDEAGMVVPEVPFDELEKVMSLEETCDFLESILKIGEAFGAEQAHEAPIAGSEMQAEVSLHLPTGQQVQASSSGINMGEMAGLAPAAVNVQPATLLPYVIPTNVPFLLMTPNTPKTPIYRYRSAAPTVVIDEDIILANMPKPVSTSNSKCFATSYGRDCPPCTLRDGRPCCGNLHGTRPRIVDTSDASALPATKKAPTADPSTNREQTLNKGKGNAVTSDLFIPTNTLSNNSSPSISSTPTVPSSPPQPTPLVATTTVAAPQAPAPRPTALNKGKGRAATSNLFIPRKTVAKKPTPSTISTTPEVPSVAVPVAPSPPAPSSSSCFNPRDKE